ncbi:MAG TPA: succinate dehydrogenase assembly factor 2 [Steroidobacteraceae bacterium]
MPDVHRRRLLWHCRRGMKELDLLLTHYVRERYGTAPAGQQAAFEVLLALPDPEIADLLLGYRTAADTDLAAVVRELSAALRVYPGTARQSVP